MAKVMLNTFVAVLISFSFSSCEKLTDTTWVYYDERKCGDAWGGNENTPEDEKIKKIEDYFKNKDIKTFKIKIMDDGTYEACESCGCKTGKRIKCKIKERDVAEMENEGFY